LDLKNKVESRAFVVTSNEGDLQKQAKGIGMLREELSVQEKMILKVNMNGMYAFCVYM
jgi:hypothetical protein